MFSPRIPKPKYELSRYSTNQLKAWLEDAALVECLVAQHNVNVNPLPAPAWNQLMESRRMKRHIADTLHDRGVSKSVIWKTLQSVKKDVYS